MPKLTAVKIMTKFNSNDPFYIAKCLGIHVLYESLGSICGYYSYYKRIRMIHINDQLDESLQRFTCAHELGHAMLHPNTNTSFLKKNTLFSTEKIEREANTFAVELLIPDEKVYYYEDTEVSIYQIAEMCEIPQYLINLKTL